MNIFRKNRPRNKEMVWGWNDPIERENPVPVSATPGPAASQVQDDFLGALASAAASEPASQGISAPVSASSAEDYNMAERLERISRRLDKLFERIDLVEHKVRRIEGKSPDY